MSDKQVIKALRGPDRVRLRPAVIFGSDDVNGIISSLKEVLDIFITEAIMGHCSKIELALGNDSSIKITSYDRGIVFDETIVDGRPMWYYDFCDFSPGPREADDEYIFSIRQKHNDLFGDSNETLPKYQVDSHGYFILTCVMYASEYMTLSSVRKGKRKSLHFKSGYCDGELMNESCNEGNKSYIHFKPDSKVFSDTNVTFENIIPVAKDTAITIPGLTMVVFDEKSGKGQTFIFPEGIKSYAEELTRGVASSPVFVNEIEARGKDRYNRREYDAFVKVAIAFVKENATHHCFHNFKSLKYGGLHYKTMVQYLLKYIQWQVDADIDETVVSNRVIVLLDTKCSEHATCWENGTRQSISNKMIADMASDVIGDDFRYFLKHNNGLLKE